MPRLKVLRNWYARVFVKLFVVSLGILWCGSGPANHLLPNRTSEPLAAKELDFEKAIQLARGGSPKESCALLSKLAARESNPDRQASLYSWLAWSAQLAGDRQVQIQAASAGLALASHDSELAARLADGLIARNGPGDLQKAEETLMAAIGQLPSLSSVVSRTEPCGRYDLYRILASVRFARRDIEGARIAADEASKTSPFGAGKMGPYAWKPVLDDDKSHDGGTNRSMAVGPGPLPGQVYR